MKKRRWGQHDARPALSTRSQRADAGPGPPRHSTTLPTNAPRQPGQRFHFLPVDETGLLPFLSHAKPPRTQRKRIEKDGPSCRNPRSPAGCAIRRARGPRLPQLSLPSHAPARRGQSRTLCLASGPSWHSCRADDETCHSRPPTPLHSAPLAAADHGQQGQRSLRGGGRNRPASFWRWNGARQAREPPSRPAPKPGEPALWPAGHARHNFPCRATPRPDAARAKYETTSPNHRPPTGNLPGARS